VNIEKHLDLIRKIVWSYTKKNPGLSFDDLFSEACIACLEAQDKYDPTKSAATTFIWYVVHNRLNSVLRANARVVYQENIEEIIDEEDEAADVEEQMIARQEWEEFMASLSENARSICATVLNEQNIYLPTDKPRACKSELTKMLRARNWSWGQIWSGYREIKLALSEMR